MPSSGVQKESPLRGSNHVNARSFLCRDVTRVTGLFHELFFPPQFRLGEQQSEDHSRFDDKNMPKVHGISLFPHLSFFLSFSPCLAPSKTVLVNTTNKQYVFVRFLKTPSTRVSRMSRPCGRGSNLGNAQPEERPKRGTADDEGPPMRVFSRVFSSAGWAFPKFIGSLKLSVPSNWAFPIAERFLVKSVL